MRSLVPRDDKGEKRMTKERSGLQRREADDEGEKRITKERSGLQIRERMNKLESGLQTRERMTIRSTCHAGGRRILRGFNVV